MDTGYPVLCGCGRTHKVSAGAAGTVFACDCGRQVQVPTLRTLRFAVGEPVATPEMEIRALLKDGHFPEEKECPCCGVVTEDICHATVVCERTGAKNTGWLALFLSVLFNLVVLYRVVLNESERPVHGHEIGFTLPLRICRECVRRLGRRELFEAMRQIPVYDRLLQKYPHAEITLERTN